MTAPIPEPTSQDLIGDADATTCSKCKDAGIECVRSVNVRFRNGLDLAEDQNIAFPESESWPRLMGSSMCACCRNVLTLAEWCLVHFHDETLETQRHYTVVDSRTIWEQENGSSFSHIDTMPEIETSQSPKLNDFLTQTQKDTEIPQIHDAYFPSSGVLHKPNEPLFSSYSEKASSLPSHSVSFNNREAMLMRNFIENMALWVRVWSEHSVNTD